LASILRTCGKRAGDNRYAHELTTEDHHAPISAARHREGLRRVESLWRSPAAVAAWERARYHQPALFTFEEINQ